MKARKKWLVLVTFIAKQMGQKESGVLRLSDGTSAWVVAL